MILAIRTDKIEAELYLIEDSVIIDEIKWHAHRQLADTIHIKIQEIIVKNNLKYGELKGLCVYKGPGSFTGLRIGIAVFNTMSYILKIPIVGTTGEDWLNDIDYSKEGDISRKNYIVPYYGKDANVTAPKK